LVEGRDAHQAVHPNLAGEQPVSERAVHREGGRLDARLFRRLMVVEHRLKALALSPAQVHAQQHFSPVLRFGPTRAGMNGHDSVQLIGFAGEQSFGFHSFGQFAQRGNFALQVGNYVFAFASELEIGGNVGAAALQFLLGDELHFQPLALAHYAL